MRKTFTFMVLSLIGLAFFFTSCEKLDLEIDVPGCVEEKIKEVKRRDVHNPPASVWKWEVDGNTYFYFTSDCCDQLNYLYDDKCNVVCAPDGGISGTGDGNCPEFEGELIKTLVWEDDRN